MPNRKSNIEEPSFSYSHSKREGDNVRTQRRILTSIMIIGLLLFSDICIAEDSIISPFAPFSWEDDLLTVTVKANNLPGVEKVGLAFVGVNMEPISLKGITNSTQLADKLSDLLKALAPHFADLNNPRTRSSPIVSAYLDNNGLQKVYLHIPLAVSASPVVVANVPFTLTIGLAPSPGFAVLQPSKVIKDSRVGYSFISVMSGVLLDSRSPALADNIREIEKIIERKYGQPPSDGTIRDEKGHSFELREDGGGATLIYAHETYNQALNEAYRKHLANLEAKKTQEKTDMKSGL